MVEKKISKVSLHAREAASEVPHVVREERILPIPRDVHKEDMLADDAVPVVVAGMGKSLSTPQLETCDDHRACLRAAAFLAYRRYGISNSELPRNRTFGSCIRMKTMLVRDAG